MNELVIKGKACKEASYELMNLNEQAKNNILEHIAQSLEAYTDVILDANKKDIEQAKQNKKPDSFIDRLTLIHSRMEAIIAGVRKVISLPDPCNITLNEWQQGELNIIKRSVPIGVIVMIYEARPNVSVDAATLCLKSKCMFPTW